MKSDYTKVGISHLRAMNATDLSSLTEPLILLRDKQPVAVVIPYKTYIEWKNLMDMLLSGHEI